MKVVVPEASRTDEYGLHAVAFMRKILTMGRAKAIQHEIEHPSWDDPEWCRMIVGLHGDSLRRP